MQIALSVEGTRIKPQPFGTAICPNCRVKLIAKCGELNVWHWAHESLVDCDNWNYEPKTEWHLNWQDKFGVDQTEIFIQRGGESHRADILSKSGVVIEIQNSTISTVDISAREEFYDKMLWVINSKEFKHNLFLRNYHSDVRKEIFFKWVRPCLPGNKLAFTVTIPYDDSKGQIERALKDCNFEKGFDNKKKEDFWYIHRNSYAQELPKEIINAFSSYLLDTKLQCSLDDRNSYPTNFKWLHMRKVWTIATKPIFIDLLNGYLFYIKTLHDNGNGFGNIISKRRFLSKYKDGKNMF